MMTKEEVASVVSYCNEHNITFKQRLEELGATEGSFYRAKYKYFSSGSSEESQGSFLQLTPGTYSHAPAMNRRPKSKKPFFSQSVSSSALSIEIKTLSGTMLRIQGVMDSTLVSSIIQATDNHV